MDSEFSSAKSGRRAPYMKKNLPVDRTKPQRSTLGQQRSLPTTPLLRGQRSPADNSANVVAKLDALRIPLIHLLAMGPDSEQNLASKTRVSQEICLRILREVGNRVGKQWQLVDDVYKDLDLWDFPYPSPMDRDQAITNTRAAFNRLRLSREASEWQMILAPGDRGKVDPNPAPPQPVKLPPKPTAPPPTITVTPESVEPSKPSLQVTKKAIGGEPIARSVSQPTAKTGKPAPKDAISRIIGKKGKKPTTAKATTAKPKGPIGRPPKSAAAKTSKANSAKEPAANSKVKSAERVEDSDEDIEMEDVKFPSPKAPEKKAVSPPPLRQTTTAMTKSFSTASSVNSDRDKDNSRLKSKKALAPNVTKSVIKKRPKSNNSSTAKRNGNGNVKAHSPQPKSLPSRDNFARRSSSNSPPKPSPLGSSPPINASDIDNTSAASSPSFPTSIAGASTPGQSPLGSMALAASKAVKPRYLPIASPPLKRKAAPAERDDRAPHSRVSTNRPPTSAAATGTNPPNKRRNTNSPDDYTIQLARKFKEDHARYERLYREVQAITDSFKKKEKIDTVLIMHRDLESLKAQISQAASVH